MITMPIDWMAYLNWVIIIWFLIDLYRGYKRGLLLQIVDVVGTFVALFGAWVVSPVFVNVFAFIKVEGNAFVSINQMLAQQMNRLIWFVILFVVIRLILLLVTPLASFISKMPIIKQVNSFVGGIFSTLFFLVKIAIVLVVLSTPIVKNGQEVVANTWLKYGETITQPLLKYTSDFIDRNDAIQSILLEQKLSDEQETALSQWLYKNGFTEREIKEFLSNYE